VISHPGRAAAAMSKVSAVSALTVSKLLWGKGCCPCGKKNIYNIYLYYIVYIIGVRSYCEKVSLGERLSV